MVKTLVLFLCLCVIGVITVSSVSSGEKGESLFRRHCAVCHPDGGNIINLKKTLHRKDLERNMIRKAEDIIKVMRNPGPGMNKFDEKTIPQNEAKEIAEFILKKFK